MPDTDKRWSLLFSDDDLRQDDVNHANGDEPTNDVSLEYRALRGLHHQLAFKTGITRDLALKTATKYSYFKKYSETLRLKATEQLTYRTDDGFDLGSEVSIRKVLDGPYVVQFDSRFNWGESTNGVEWNSGLSLNQKTNAGSNYSYFVYVEGETRPQYLTTEYGIGYKYRKDIYNSWVFIEFVPVYNWIKPDPAESREHGIQTTLSLELLFSGKPRTRVK